MYLEVDTTLNPRRISVQFFRVLSSQNLVRMDLADESLDPKELTQAFGRCHRQVLAELSFSFLPNFHSHLQDFNLPDCHRAYLLPSFAVFCLAILFHPHYQAKRRLCCLRSGRHSSKEC